MLDASTVLASASDCIKIWDTAEDKLNLNTQYTTGSSTYKDVSWNVNNSRLACISNGNGIIVYNFQEGVKHGGTELSESKEQTAVCFGSTKDELYSGCATGDVNQWSCSTFERTNTYSSAHGSAVTRLTRMGDRLVSASAKGELLIWQTSTASILAKLNATKSKSIRGLEHSRYDRSLLSTTSDEGIVSLWDAEKQVTRHNFTSHSAPAMDLSFSTINALLLVSGGLDKKVIFYDVKARNSVKTITSVQPITAVCFLGNGMHICAGTSMGNILLYDLRNDSEPLSSLQAHTTSVQRLVLQTLKERKRSSRASSSKSAEKRTSRTKHEIIGKPPTIQPVGQENSQDVANKRLNHRNMEIDTVNSIPQPAVEKTPQITPKSVSTESSLPPVLETPGRHNTASRDTLGSYCEQLFSPVGSINGSINNISAPSFTHTRSKELGVNHSGKTNSPFLHISSRTPDTNPMHETNQSRLHTPLTRSHIVHNGNGNHKPVLSSTPANPEAHSSVPSQHDESAIRSSQRNTPSQQTSLSTITNGAQGVPRIDAQSSATFQYQLDFLKNTVQDLIEDHEENMRDELRHMHLQFIKMFAELQESNRQLAEQCSVNPLLLQEIERLRKENDRLRRKY